MVDHKVQWSALAVDFYGYEQEMRYLVPLVDLYGHNVIARTAPFLHDRHVVGKNLVDP